MKKLLIVPLLFLFTNCPNNLPQFHGKMYRGDSSRAGFMREVPGQPFEFISCSDPIINSMVATDATELINWEVEVNQAFHHCSCK
jgi:hypothetical protein